MKQPRSIHDDRPSKREAILETVINQAMPQNSMWAYRIARYLLERWNKPWMPTKAKHGLCWLTICESLERDGWLVKIEGKFCISPALKLRTQGARLQLVS